MTPRRFILSLLLCLAALQIAGAAPLPPAEREATLRYLAGLQNPDGGFRPAAAAGPSGLGPTVQSTRAFHYLDAAVPHREAAVRFVQSCRNAAGGYGETPGAKPDVRSTAMGLMALAQLKARLGEEGEAVRGYFRTNAKELAEIYIAEAALSSADLRPPDAGAWMAVFAATRNADGSYGKSVADTARAVVTALRMGLPLPDRAATLRALKAAQKPDGGFAAGDASDLATSYPVMRAFFMLTEKPDLRGVRNFAAKCRNADGGYGVSPGQPSTSAGTYYASVILYWAEQLGGGAKPSGSAGILAGRRAALPETTGSSGSRSARRAPPRSALASRPASRASDTGSARRGA